MTLENLFGNISDEEWLEALKKLFGSDENVKRITIEILESKIDRLEQEDKELQEKLSVYKKILETLKEEQCSTY